MAWSSIEEKLTSNLARIREGIDRALERSGRKGPVKILAVTKGVSPALIEKARELGISIFGENRVQEAREKVGKGTFAGAELHFIGHLQTNKASLAARIFSCVQSVDSTRVAFALSKASVRYGKVCRVMIEVNVGRDPAKFGVSPEDSLDLARYVLGLPGLVLTGLMTVAPEDPGVARRVFRGLASLRDRLLSEGIPRDALSELSMGMTSDYEIAVEEGSTMVRIGRGLFGERA
ncbi:MAG TPA: YggS family pyridoxal phosphate-dependent enzyme [Firmicutes bacterium]|nr:YggS family pyridoxal phosphate-dependent enzyme [Candidatus Fermentithermobacillaceae bacterium]